MAEITTGPRHQRLAELCDAHLRPIKEWHGDASGFTPIFAPPLSPAEKATLDELEVMARHGVTMTLAEWRAIKEDAAGLRQYLGLSSPTAAQTALATQAIIRVLATIIRD